MNIRTQCWTTAGLALLAVLLSAGPAAADALQFNGVNQSVQVPDSASLRQTNRITIEAWIRRAATGVQHSIVEKYGCTAGQGGYALRVTSADKLLFGTRDDCNNGSSVVGLASIPANVWTHVAGSWDGTTLRVFINGVQDNSLASTRNPKAGNTSLRIGERGNGGTSFNGLIDEVRLWSVARTAAELAAIRTTCLAGNEAGLVANWRLDDGAGAAATDLTANANTGTLVNGPAWISTPDPISCSTVVKVVATMNQAAEPATSGLFTLTRGGLTTQPLTVNFAITGSAGNGVDYANITGSAIIPANAASVDVPVTVLDDTLREGTETVILTLSASVNYRVDAALGSATVMIADDDFLPSVKAVVPDGLAAEVGGDTGTFRLERTGSTVLPLTVNFFLRGTTTPGVDCNDLGTSVEIPAGAAFVNLTVYPTNDAISEIRESLSLVLSPDAGYTIGFPENATMFLDDMPTLPMISIQATRSQTAEGSTNDAIITITRTGPTVIPLEVFFAVETEAISGVDFTPLGFSIEIPAGQSSARLFVHALDDLLFEPTKELVVMLTPSFTYELTAVNFALVFLLDNDQPPQVNVQATDPAAGETGPNTGTFTIGRLGNTDAPLTIFFTLGGTASNGVDFAALSGSVEIPAGAATVPVTVTPIDDPAFEGTETVSLFLSVNANYAVGPTNVAVMTIADNDAPAANALQLDGVNDSVQPPSSASLSITGPITVEAWIKRAVSGVQHSIVEKYGCTAPAGGYALRVTASDKLLFGTRDDCNNGSSVSGATSIPAGVWTHVAGSWDGTTLRVFINGVPDGLLATTRNPKTGNTPLKIGERGNGGTPFNGMIDDVRVWNVARTAAQITANRGQCLTGTETGLAGYWKLDEGAGLTAFDATANHNDGPLLNGPVWTASIAPVTCGGGGGGGAPIAFVEGVSAPTLALAADASGGFMLRIASAPGATCLIQVSSDLKNWSDLATVASETGSVQYHDTAADGGPVRFYRVIQNP